jgi:transcriptional regulator with XRE-family HTH domain
MAGVDLELGDVKRAFGSAIKELRESQPGGDGERMSQRELADIAGLRAQALSRLERGQVFPRLDTIVRLTQALQVSPGRPFALMAAELGLAPAEDAEALEDLGRELLQVEADLDTAGVPRLADGDVGGDLPLSVPERLRWLLRNTRRSDLDDEVYMRIQVPGEDGFVYDVSVESGQVSATLEGAKSRSLRMARIRKTVILSALGGVKVAIVDAEGSLVE